MSEIWDLWVPGALSRRQLRKMCEDGFITGVRDDELGDIGHSSIDLHLTREAYELEFGSIKPTREKGFLDSLIEEGLATKIDPDGDGCFRLLPLKTFLFELREGLDLKNHKMFYGQATAKSTIGRVDVLARLIVDGMDHYERFDPNDIGSGSTKMFVEITPISFTVVVKEGIPISQLRLFLGEPESCQISGDDIVRTCFYNPDEGNKSTLSVDLSTVIVEEEDTCGFCAKESSRNLDPIPLWKEGRESRDPAKWWCLVKPASNLCRIPADRFHILRSKERLTVPPGVAVYARAIDEEIGEMRIHYAGFVHPNFGLVRSDKRKGTPLIFEVRGHNLEVILRDGEILARLQFYRMSEESHQTEKEKQEIRDKKDDSYASQGLNLSRIFSDDWVSPPEIVLGGPHA